MKRRAFTLIEMMVVMAIIAILAAMSLGVVSSLREGNKRATCQSNLNQVYSAARLYAQDFDGQLPYFNPTDTPNSAVTPPGGLGLWALYAYPPASSDPLNASQCNPTNALPVQRNDAFKDAPLASYIKSPRIFHCPSDNFEQPVSYATGPSTCATANLTSSELSFDPGDGIRRFNPSYLSYQVTDDAPSVPTYSTFRGKDVKRQLRFFSDKSGSITIPDRRAPDQTVVTWCRFHRRLDATGATKAGDNSFDNVLFLDGSVQRVSVAQSIADTSGTTKTCDGWKRVPLAEADKVPTSVSGACS